MVKHTVIKRKLFNPDDIATAISQKLNRDLSEATQMYGHGNSLQQFYREAQKESTLKKYDPTTGNETELEEQAFRAFLETNARINVVNLEFRQPRDIQANHLSPNELLLKRARALVHWTLRDITWGELASNVTHSGGVTKGVSFQDTSLEAKFTWPMTATEGAANLFRQYLVHDPRLCAAVEELNGQEQILLGMFDITDASRATTVPKTASKRRMIAIEPTLNMFFQQSLMTIMYQRLKDVGLDVESLPMKHQDLALDGSVTGACATIDFSSASDCVSIELLRYLLPNRWFEYITKVRCPSMEIAGETVDLSMVSTMGNAGTFPLETLVFWALGVGAVMQRTRSNPFSLLSLPEEREMVSVFGDDCILPTEDAKAFMAIAESVGFLVNKEKSFYDPGPGFRESCGGDYLRGSNVRPLFIKAPTSTRLSALEPWLYIQLNNLLKKYIMYFGDLKYVYDQHALEYIFSLFAKHRLKVKLVPGDFPDDSGLKTTDWKRLQNCYNVVFDKVAVTEQGWCEFRYVRFVYKDSRARDEHLRFAIWLKRPIVRNEWWIPAPKTLNLFPVRRKGGYIVAKARAPNWGL